MEFVNTLIVGASAAGLSCAAQLSKKNIDFEIIEAQDHIAHAWRNHYDRLHLHTNKSGSNLPFLKFPKEDEKYPSRIQVIKYLENYCDTFGIKPVFNTSAQKISKADGHWITETNNGTFKSRNVIICTGKARVPKKYDKPGLETFKGPVIHSSEYKNGQEFRDKKVLVVGFGNSACEIAICLHEHGAKPTLSVRSPVNIVPRDILGIPVLTIGIWQSKLPIKLSDKLNKPLLRLLVGNFEKYGLRKLPYGPAEQILKHHRIPLLDVGTMDLIRKGKINVRGDVAQVQNDSVRFDDGKEEQFDAIIAAVGYETGLDSIITIDDDRKADIKEKITARKLTGKDHIYFCGFHVSRTGMLREIALESGIIASMIQERTVSR